MTEQDEPVPGTLPNYAPPKGVRQIHPKQAAPLLKMFSKMIKRGKYRSQTTRPRRKKTRIV